MFIAKEKDNVEIDNNGNYNTTLKYGLYGMLINGNKFDRKIGHIEVSITTGEKCVDDRLENFMKAACCLFDEMVLKNTEKKFKTKFEMVK